MCFKNKNGRKVLVSRRYTYNTGKYFLNFKTKENRNILEVNITHKDGDISFVLLDENGKEIVSLNNPKTGQYLYTLEVGKRYKSVIETKHHSGGYSVYL